MASRAGRAVTLASGIAAGMAAMFVWAAAPVLATGVAVGAYNDPDPGSSFAGGLVWTGIVRR